MVAVGEPVAGFLLFMFIRIIAISIAINGLLQIMRNIADIVRMKIECNSVEL
jgi:hypothetical protein